MSNRFPPSARLRAFTLVELLVVVAIIVVLIGVLMPQLAKARQVAKKARCQANLHEIGLAIVTYCTQNNDIMPTGQYIKIDKSLLNGKFAFGSGTVGSGWQEELIADGCLKEPINNTNLNATGYGVFLCPSADDAPYYALTGQMTDSERGYGLSSFATSTFGNDGSGNEVAPNPSLKGATDPNGGTYSTQQVLDLYRYSRLSNHIIGSDGSVGMSDGASPWSPSGQANIPNSAGNPFLSRYGIYMRHFKAPNYLFADGHVEWSDKYHILKVPNTPTKLLDPTPWQHLQSDGSIKPQ